MRYIERVHGYHPGEQGLRIGRLVVQVSSNACGAPLLDHAWLTTGDGRRFGGRCLSLVRRRNRHGERESGRALFFGWRKPSLGTASVPATATLGPGMETGG